MRRVEDNGYPLSYLDVFKLARGNGVISPSSYLDVLKIKMERKGKNLNRQIYPYLKMDLQHKPHFSSFLLFFYFSNIAYNFHVSIFLSL